MSEPLVQRYDSLTVGNVTFRSMTSEERVAYRELLAGRLVKVAMITPERLTKLEAVVAAAREMRLFLFKTPCPKCKHSECASARAFDAAMARLEGK